MNWRDVTRIHKSRGGVHIEEGKIVSLLAIENSHYKNKISPDLIRYGLSPNAGKAILKAFDSALAEGYSIKIFHKIEIGVWEYLGLFKITKIEKSSANGLQNTLIHYNLVPYSLVQTVA